MYELLISFCAMLWPRDRSDPHCRSGKEALRLQGNALDGMHFVVRLDEYVPPKQSTTYDGTQGPFAQLIV
jgi:hypothetical protein